MQALAVVMISDRIGALINRMCSPTYLPPGYPIWLAKARQNDFSLVEWKCCARR
jgi:hypothetical protein